MINTNKKDIKMRKINIKKYLNKVWSSNDYETYKTMCAKPYWTWTQNEKMIANILSEAKREGLLSEQPAYIVKAS